MAELCKLQVFTKSLSHNKTFPVDMNVLIVYTCLFVI